METLDILNVVISQIHNLCQVLCDSRCGRSVTPVPECSLHPFTALEQHPLTGLSPHPSLFRSRFFPPDASCQHEGFGELHGFRVETWNGACGFRGTAVWSDGAGRKAPASGLGSCSLKLPPFTSQVQTCTDSVPCLFISFLPFTVPRPPSPTKMNGDGQGIFHRK